MSVNKNVLELRMKNFKINEVKIDDFGRASGILLLNKPVNITSHDLVNKLREKYQTKKVGHAGALDPFATGLMIMLIGKATSLSNQFLELDKTYKTRIVFGIDTDSGDVEGKILNAKKFDFNFDKVKKAILKFSGGYDQFVPVFSSVKVNGKKLRKLARTYSHFEIVGDSEKKEVLFYSLDGKFREKLNLPKRPVKIYDIKVLSYGKYDEPKEIFGNFYNEENCRNLEKIMPVNFIDVEFSCSKGTYVRQFAKDLANELGTFVFLNKLERKAIGNFTLEMAVDL
ncbi:MAG: hypothetical protein KatS3mg085_819 [Candidatus Dojkabacteria bacterium]|nr:MAG: hypothetical protein KatS3mg085_819 [Candidatus Dojkabacteria bacterium]